MVEVPTTLVVVYFVVAIAAAAAAAAVVTASAVADDYTPMDRSDLVVEADVVEDVVVVAFGWVSFVKLAKRFVLLHLLVFVASFVLTAVVVA
ncbi:hypothetical protein BDF20DRAFT_870866 [Mycotypha africana]|uniref:uncharacterized protein n=1 Tax=Mycotypha africana TaxID=64632 RepID=UPI002301B559|nr:uncharacterized protein BDF20DRAFT_870866 [Mycotypha africana]KAI8979658.1 hypothetical protein BDF20DRAFT_870866 [Mycotypha africana]